MPKTHIIVRQIPGTDYRPGDEVDATLWRNAERSVDQRYLRPLNKDELRAKGEPSTRERIAIKAEARLAASRLMRLRANAASGDPGAKAELERVEKEMAEAEDIRNVSDDDLKARAGAGDKVARKELKRRTDEAKAEETALKAKAKQGDPEAIAELQRRKATAKAQ